MNPVRLPKKLITGFNRDQINGLIDRSQAQDIIESPDVKPNYTTKGVMLRIVHQRQAKPLVHRWKVEASPANVVTVGEGKWRRNGIVIKWDEDAPAWNDGVPTGTWVDGINFIIAVLDDATTPTGISMTVDDEEPAVDDEVSRVLAIVSYDATAGVATGIKQTMFSDITDTTGAQATIVHHWDAFEQDCMPETPAGYLWEFTGATIVSGVIHMWSRSRCLSRITIPGTCPITGSINLNTDTETGGSVSFTAGLCGAAEGTVFLVGTEDGATVEVTVGAGGILTGYTGVIAIGDPATGTTSFYRIGSTGKLEQ